MIETLGGPRSVTDVGESIGVLEELRTRAPLGPSRSSMSADEIASAGIRHRAARVACAAARAAANIAAASPLAAALSMSRLCAAISAAPGSRA